MGILFGTDGIRGEADGPLFTDPQLVRIAAGLAQYFEAGDPHKPVHAVMGRDTRASGYRILETLAAALAAFGVRVMDAGVAPTPAIAKAILDADCDFGVVVTASHNPASDNGIKLFAHGGVKFSVEVESAIEAAILAVPESIVVPETEEGERCVFPCDAVGPYVAYAASLLHAGDLAGWKIVVDTAHGATVETTPDVLRALGAEVVTLGDRPDGANINAGVGSEYPDPLAAAVRAEGARLGIAHDGDGDRVIFVDETGSVVPGDCVIGLLALAMMREDILPQQAVAATVMSNLGLDAALVAEGGRVVRTGVGDRQVATAMAAEGLTLGGESSGHLILQHWLPTGDGLLAALAVLREMRMSGQPLSALAAQILLYPQRMCNLRVAAKPALATLEGWETAVSAIEASIPGGGRVLVRYSGTEPKIRLLAEAPTDEAAETALADLIALAKERLEVLPS